MLDTFKMTFKIIPKMTPKMRPAGICMMFQLDGTTVVQKLAKGPFIVNE